MGEKSVYKSLFKKLSALRATLTDEEQMLLDRMVTGEHEGSAQGTEQNEITSHSITTTTCGTVICVSYDPEKEIYLVD
ncbi:MAG: hypothetical protein KJ046_15435 [Anaerolineae bacterium]|nr:hypothetical protein [Anaerolineae bacterium]RIK17936.1 MAG: hypothetical protein DCC51_11810 [Anaerolineae bacterium]